MLEIGGTHVVAALVEQDAGRPGVITQRRHPLDSAGSAEEIVGTLVVAARELGETTGPWGVAVPGPFDYAAGIGRFHGVGKFDALRDVPLGEQLGRRLGTPAGDAVLRFVNDADAYGLGEWSAGAALGHDRVVCLTLGTGVGSAFLVGGRPVQDGPGVPPEGSAHLLSWRGRALEDIMSRRALCSAYAERTGRSLDVREIFAAARDGEAEASAVVGVGLEGVAGALAPWVERFGADVLVVGGSISRSWDLVGPALAAAVPGTAVRAAELVDQAPLVGAALHARRWGTAEPD